MILKMSGVTLLYVLLTALIWNKTRNKKLSPAAIFGIGLIYGLCSVLSTHFGIDYGHMLLNVRDLGPLSAGLFFHPVAGIISGLIGGIERYIAGTYWSIGSYTRIACSVSTLLAGFVAAVVKLLIIKHEKPVPVTAFFMGAAMEVFHMYTVLITHRDDMNMAYYVVRNCSAPMILFSGIGLAVSASVLQIMDGEWRNPFISDKEKTHLSERFQRWLFGVITIYIVINFLSSFGIQTQKSIQDARNTLTQVSASLRNTYEEFMAVQEELGDSGSAGLKEDPDRKRLSGLNEAISNINVGRDGSFEIIDTDGYIFAGRHIGENLTEEQLLAVQKSPEKEFFRDTIFETESICIKEQLNNGSTLLTQLPLSEVYENRNAGTYETVFQDILLVTGIYLLISILVQKIVVDDLEKINLSLNRITDGNLNEVVTVRNSSEFAELSDDINQTVSVLKEYIAAAEKRMAEELMFARTIQESALPRNFNFPRTDFEIYASMDPAKEVGGDFYDFFFVDKDKLALVIADVSGKGIPAALFMMRSKTAIRTLAEAGDSPAEIFTKVNAVLSEGNDAEIFVTVWIGIIDLTTGMMQCSNAGHEYPVIMRANEKYELMKEKHSLALAAMPSIRTRAYEIQFNPGDRLFVYTDGIPEAINEQIQAYGEERMLRKLNDVRDLNMEKTLTAVRQDLSDFVGDAEQFDDITMLGFIYRGTNSETEEITENPEA